MVAPGSYCDPTHLDGDELVERLAGRQVVVGVLADRRLDDAQRGRQGAHRGRHSPGVLAPGLVLVLNDRDVRAAQELAVLVTPLAGAVRVAGGDDAHLAQRLDVLLALNQLTVSPAAIPASSSGRR